MPDFPYWRLEQVNLAGESQIYRKRWESFIDQATIVATFDKKGNELQNTIDLLAQTLLLSSDLAVSVDATVWKSNDAASFTTVFMFSE